MTKYSLESKKKVVSIDLNNEGGYKTLSYEIGVSSDVIKQWIKAYQYHGIAELKGGGKSYPSVFKEHVLNYIEEHEPLEQEVERLRAENVYLKKLATLVHARNLSKKNLRLKRS